MPIYEFFCNNCQQKVSLFFRSISTDITPTCPSCNSTQIIRIISNFAYHRSEGMRQEHTSSSNAPFGITDPRDIGLSTENQLKSMGIDIDSPEHKEKFSSLRSMIDSARDGDMSFLDK